ncbi:M6 family metalloprotease domain-containing protein [Fibrobacter sp. UWB12]|uniref:M6 family metalloprotease domain-containing protein n=1 Tax=Fibrobacter sp. UWB12 TaxID=1896203 RepID=UPI00090FF393|nr:M6 family metalloprotease domain-containing protein [Fibrobacter sp. UWB12]SHK54615.1 M6 family metalloprotease domain-containing protein [Fibrobacter sp. UWB12]
MIGSLVGTASVWAVKAAPFLINSTQPDGSVVQIRKVGNEHFNYTVTGDDSVLVVRDSSGYWNYADEHGKKTGMRVHAKSKRGAKEKNFLKKRNSRQILENFREKRLKQLEEQRSSEPQVLQSSSPMKANAWGGRTTQNTNTPMRPSVNNVKKEGDVRGLVILVQFSDVKFKRDNAYEEYHDFLNKEGYSNYFMKGSARDFFILNSSGKYRPTFDVYGPITLKGTRDSYGALVDPNNIAAGAVNAVSEAMDSLVAAGVDFTPYDSDNDRIVDFVYMIYAGVGSADTDVQSAIWPHSYNVSKRLTRNMSMYRYACSPEIDGQAYLYRKSTDALNGIGTFCHEFSHVLGLQDHYDVYVNDTRMKVRYTPGAWDLMDAGSYNCPQNKYKSTSCSPANLSAFERFSLGWLEPRRLEISDTTFVLKTIQENDGLVLTSKNDAEYYFVDFRLKQDFDEGLPNQGLLIWHINYDRYSWMYNEVNTTDPMKVDLVEADGKADVYSAKDDAFPTSRGVNSYNGFVTWGGDSLGLEVYDIKIVDDHVEFKTRGSRVSPVSPASSSSAVRSSSSKAVSSSSKPASSSSSVSSSSVSSSSKAKSSSSNVISSTSKDLSSSSEPFMFATQNIVPSAVQFSVADRALKVHADIDGLKTVALFDVNGTLLMKKSFADKYCEVHMDNLRGKALVIAVLELNGQVVKSKKIKVK